MMLKIFTRIDNYILIKRFPFLLCRNVWNDVVDKKYDFTWLDDMPRGWKKRFGINICNDLKDCFLKSWRSNFVNEYRIVQIKEKYGQLRWYDNGVPQDIQNEYDKIIDYYTKLSEHTCTRCGKEGTIDNKQYWIEPLCDKHYKKFYNINKK